MNRHTGILVLIIAATLGVKAVAGVPCITEGLVAHWSLDEGSGTTAYDWVGNNHGTISAGQRIPGVIGNAVSLNGTSSYIDIPDSPELRPYNHQLSVGLWVNPLYQGGTPHVTVIRKGIGCGVPGWGIDCDGFTGSSSIWFWGLPSGPQHYLYPSWLAVSSDSAAIGEWQFIVGTIDGTEAKLYIDGTVSGQSAVDKGRQVYNEYPITVGANYANCGYWHNRYKGSVDEIYLYNRALTEREVGCLYSGCCPQLLVVIPGINDDGEEMVEGACDLSPTACYILEIREVWNLSEPDIRDRVTTSSLWASEYGMDLVVNIDMDLEDYTVEYVYPPAINRWAYSTIWAGRIANVVSEAFTTVVPDGRRIVYSHSAGGDATYQSILQSLRRKNRKMYDDINILNGRTNAGKLSRVLGQCGYEWSEVKIFTSQADLPAGLSIPLLNRVTPWFKGSISNKDAAANMARQGAWVHLHCKEVLIGSQWFEPEHSTLRDYYDCQAKFQVYTSQVHGQLHNDTFIGAMLTDWSSW